MSFDPFRHLKSPLDSVTFIVFDLETTGGNPQKSGITEICALKVHQGQIIDQFYSLVNPRRRIPPIVRKMTGITDQMVRHAPDIQSLMPSFLEFVSDFPIVSHNIHGDLQFLNHFAWRFCKVQYEPLYLCTHLLSERVVPQTKSRSLKGLAEHFGVDVKGVHRAEVDAHLTYQVFRKQEGLLLEKGVTTLAQAIRLQGDFDSQDRLGWDVPQEKISAQLANPGVIFLFDTHRNLLFLTSSVSLKDDLVKMERRQQVSRTLKKQILKAADFEVMHTPSIFEAILEEIEHSKAYHHLLPAHLFHNRFLEYINLRQLKDGMYKLSFSHLEEGVCAAIEPPFDRKGFNNFIRELAKIFDIPQKKKDELYLDPQKAMIIKDFLSGKLPDAIQSLEKQQSFWFKKVILLLNRTMQKQLQAAKNILELTRHLNIRPVFSQNGFVLLNKTKKADHQVVFVYNSCPFFKIAVTEKFIEEKKFEFLEKEFHEKVTHFQLHKKACLSSEQAASISLFLWWKKSHFSRSEAEFIDISL